MSGWSLNGEIKSPMSRCDMCMHCKRAYTKEEYSEYFCWKDHTIKTNRMGYPSDELHDCKNYE